MPKKTKKAARPAAKPKKTHAELFKEAVKAEGSGGRVAKRLGCSQQSVSAWASGTNPPRPKMQQKIKEIYNIPEPWTL